MIGLFDYLKIGAGALVGALLAYQVGHWRGDRAGYQRFQAEVAVANTKAEMERKGDDAKLRGMSDYDLCVAGLRDQRLPIDPCAVMRRLPEE